MLGRIELWRYDFLDSAWALAILDNVTSLVAILPQTILEDINKLQVHLHATLLARVWQFYFQSICQLISQFLWLEIMLV